MVREVDVRAQAAAHRDGAVVVDVREAHEYRREHVPGAGLIPLGQVRARLAELPILGPVYVICASSNRSRTAAAWMAAARIDARSVAGCTEAWIRVGGPVVRGSHAHRLMNEDRLMDKEPDGRRRSNPCDRDHHHRDPDAGRPRLPRHRRGGGVRGGPAA